MSLAQGPSVPLSAGSYQSVNSPYSWIGYDGTMFAMAVAFNKISAPNVEALILSTSSNDGSTWTSPITINNDSKLAILMYCHLDILIHLDLIINIYFMELINLLLLFFISKVVQIMVHMGYWYCNCYIIIYSECNY